MQPNPTLPRIAALCVAALITSTECHADFTVEQWANFEEGKLPPGARIAAANPQEAISIVELSSIPNMPTAFYGSNTGRETGRFALKLVSRPDPKDFKTQVRSMAIGDILDRSKLGTDGVALYQADFYIPPEGQQVPNLAVLAMEALPTTATRNNPMNFYRFGFVKNQSVYFSCVQEGQKTASVYKQDNNIIKQIPRPGWHRLAISFEGTETIRCYIDGRQLSFSPITDKALTKLQVGIMLADSKGQYDCFADNLSIQKSSERSPVPASPYSAGWTLRQESAAVPADAGLKPLTSQGIAWKDATVAWTDAQKSRKPFLLYFYSPVATASQKLEEIIAAESAPVEFLKNHECARIDVNQLQGGTLARQYGIIRVPTVIVFSPEGQRLGQARFDLNDTWQTFTAKLRGQP